MRHGEWRCFGVYDNGRLVGIWGAFRDLSQLLLLTKELQIKADELSKLSEEQVLPLEDIRRQADQLSVLDEGVWAVIQRREIVSVAGTVIDGLKSLFPETGLAVVKHDPSTNTLKLISGNERALTVFSRISSDPFQAIHPESFQTLSLTRQGKTVKVSDLSELNSEAAKALVDEGYRFAVSCPLYVGNDFLGFLTAFRGQGKPFTEDECDFLQRVANHLAIAFYNAQLFEELQRAYDELRQAQAMLVQQERLKALGQMASGIYHDIGRMPLSL